MASVLVIDDDIDIHTLIDRVFKNEFEMYFGVTLAEGESIIKEKAIDFLILDEMLPDGSGKDFCHRIKNSLNKSELPVIMLTQRKELEDKLTAFDSGVDDYMVKPFEPLELLARIKARAKKANEGAPKEFEMDGMFFNLTKQSLEIENEDGRNAVDLTPIEFKILYIMANKPNEVFSREKILHEVWGESNHVVDRTVDQHVSKVRRKISPSKYTIRSAHGKGYKFTLNNKS